MLQLALRNLLQNKPRLVMSTAGLALALLLILSLDAIFLGAESQISAYIDRSGADVWVSQSDVRNLHMASSTLPLAMADRVRAVPGVASVTPILYVQGMVNTGHDNHLAYVIGLPANPAAGGPWKVTAGTGVPGPGEAVIDRTVAQASGIGVGASVTILTNRFRVVGLTDGTVSIVNSVAFISMADFTRIRGTSEFVSYLLVKVAPGRSPDAVASSIEREVGGVTALSRVAFGNEERRVVEGMSTDLINLMNTIGLLIGLAVLALSIYTATMARRAEYGVLKAMGARNRDLYRVVLTQAAVGVLLGLLVSVALVLTLSAAIPFVRPNLALEVSAMSIAKVAAVALVIGGLAAVLPVRQIAGLDPATIFRRRMQ